MAETIISPGVLATENDQTFITSQPIEAGAAIIGPTVKGPVEKPTIVTSYSDYILKFGDSFLSGSQTYTYLTSLSTKNYFDNGGTSLLVTRVTSGSFTSATSSVIYDSGSLNNVFILETLAEGEIMNSESTLNSDGTLPSGSIDNIRWQITGTNTTDGTFSLLIRRGDDSTNSPIALETWTNLSLDPYSSNYVEKVIGNQTETLTKDGTDYYIALDGEYENKSNYVRIKQVNIKTPNYFDNSGVAKSVYTSSIPIASSGSFGSAVGSNIPTGKAGQYYQYISDPAISANHNTQGLIPSDYDDAISLLTNKDIYNYDFITTPGLIYNSTFTNSVSTLNTLITNCKTRGDVLAVIDSAKYGSQLNTVVSNVTSLDNSYAATYWPWLKTLDPTLSTQVWVPASTMIPGIYAFNDNVAYPWFAPAGTTRGNITNASAERVLTQGNRDTLYKSNINPIATFPGAPGVVVYGQKTLQKRKSSLDRINVRRLLIELKFNITQFANDVVFEQNTSQTRRNFLNVINPYLATVQQLQGLENFRVVMDETNNTPTTIDNNQLIGQIYIQPTRTIEFILLDFNITPTGVTFE